MTKEELEANRDKWRALRMEKELGNSAAVREVSKGESKAYNILCPVPLCGVYSTQIDRHLCSKTHDWPVEEARYITYSQITQI